MFYTVDYDWVFANERYEPAYHIKHAYSTDGINWIKTDKVILPADYAKEECVARPTVIKTGNKYHMWFSYRSSHDFRDGKGTYRIGYAWSEDFFTWKREDEKAGIFTSEKGGWDSTMITYPFILKVEGKYLMFYNGNTFGKYGFGYAVLNPDG